MSKIIEKYGDVELQITRKGRINILQYNFVPGKVYFGAGLPKKIAFFDSLAELKSNVNFQKNL